MSLIYVYINVHFQDDENYCSKPYTLHFWCGGKGVWLHVLSSNPTSVVANVHNHKSQIIKRPQLVYLM